MHERTDGRADALAGEAIRLTLMMAHYRQPLDFTKDLLQQSKQALDRFYGMFAFALWDRQQRRLTLAR